jgi:hypothetical protein
MGAGSLATAPNSVAAAASFDATAAVGAEHTITFETSPLGVLSSLALASGVSLTGTNVNSNDQTIVNTTSNLNVPSCSNASCGYDTTPGGSNFLLLFGGTATFSFREPLQKPAAVIL